MSTMSEKHADRQSVIDQLEADGWTVTPPRNDQRDWQIAVGLLLSTFHHSIKKPFHRGDVVLTEQSRFTLASIRDEIEEMLK